MASPMNTNNPANTTTGTPGGSGILSNFVSENAIPLLGGILGGVFGMSGSPQQSVGYQGGIPDYTAKRSLEPNAFAQTTTDPDTGETVARRPGSMGRRYFTDVQYVPSSAGAVMQGTGLPAVVDQPEADTEALSAGDLAGLLSLLSSLGINVTPTASTFTPGVSDTTTTTTTTPAESTFSLGDTTTTTTDVSVASDPVSQYLQSLGYGPTASPVSATDIQSAVGEGFSLADIAGAFGTTEDVLNQILNPSSSTTISTPASSAFTAGDTTTSTTVIENALNDFFAGRGFVAGEEQTVTQADLNAAIAAGFSKEQLATGLGTTVDNINAVLDYQYAEGGTVNDAVELAMGGMAQGQGYYLGGPTDGMADLIPATIDGAQPAALSDGEFVIPADVVSHLGNGNSDAGAEQLYSMMDRVRTERTGTTKQGPEINPTKMMPA